MPVSASGSSKKAAIWRNDSLSPATAEVTDSLHHPEVEVALRVLSVLLQALIDLDREIQIREHPAAPVLQHEGLIAVSSDDVSVVADHDHRAVLARQEQRVVTLLMEAVITNGHHFVNQKAFEVDSQRHCKCKPNLHAAGIV